MCARKSLRTPRSCEPTSSTFPPATIPTGRKSLYSEIVLEDHFAARFNMSLGHLSRHVSALFDNRFLQWVFMPLAFQTAFAANLLISRLYSRMRPYSRNTVVSCAKVLVENLANSKCPNYAPASRSQQLFGMVGRLKCGAFIHPYTLTVPLGSPGRFRAPVAPVARNDSSLWRSSVSSPSFRLNSDFAFSQLRLSHCL